MHAQLNQAHELLPLTEAAKSSPGRPSTNCMWRWCRRGVIARSGQRVKLEHVRIGGKIFTSRSWVEEFGKRLAAADASYFDAPSLRTESAPVTDSPEYELVESCQIRPTKEEIERDLEEAGL